MATTVAMPRVEANGASIPQLGFGTWQLRDDVARSSVEHAIRAGYRHIDTAQIYENEAQVGEGIRAAGVAREALWLTTKVWWDRFRAGELERSVEESLKRLGTDHVDLLLLHWPSREVPLAETMKALCAVREQGLTRHIGVSNFTTRLIEEAVALSTAPLVTDQVEYHPYLDQSKVMAALKKHGMALTAYSPLGKGSIIADPVITDIATATGHTPAQVVLRWHIQQGVIAIPRSSNPQRIQENLGALGFELSDHDMSRLSALKRPNGRMISPSFGPDWD